MILPFSLKNTFPIVEDRSKKMGRNSIPSCAPAYFLQRKSQPKLNGSI